MVNNSRIFFETLKVPPPNLPKYVQGYNMPRTKDKLLSWNFVSKTMLESEYYCIASIDSKRYPHTVPVWGIWFENRVFFDGNPQTKWIRNLKANPKVSVHVPSPNQVCIIEGNAIILGDTDLTKEEWDILDQTHRIKYNKLFGSPFIYVNPLKILAWDAPEFKRMTIWAFD